MLLHRDKKSLFGSFIGVIAVPVCTVSWDDMVDNSGQSVWILKLPISLVMATTCSGVAAVVVVDNGESTPASSLQGNSTMEVSIAVFTVLLLMRAFRLLDGV